MHLIWSSILVPPMIFASIQFPFLRKAEVWGTGLVMSLCALAGLIGWDVSNSNLSEGYSLLRGLAVVLLQVDLPLLGFTMGLVAMGCVSIFWGMPSQREANSEVEEQGAKGEYEGDTKEDGAQCP